MPINYQGSGGGVPRKTAKIFAKNANANDMTVFGSTLANNTQYSTDLESIQSAHYEVGWREAVISNLNYPLLSDMNAVQHTLSQQIAYTLQHGIPEWDASTTYYAYDIVQSGGILYTSIIDNNTNNTVTDTTKWAVYYDPNNYLTKQQVTNCMLELPNALITASGRTITVGAGLKVLIPNGRKADGTLNNIEYTLSSNATYTYAETTSIFPDYVFINSQGVMDRVIGEDLFFLKDASELNQTGSKTKRLAYLLTENIWKFTNDGATTWEDVQIAILCVVYFTGTEARVLSNPITMSLYNSSVTGKMQADALSFPSDYYQPLTWGATNTVYQAPGNGYFHLYRATTSANDFICLQDEDNISAIATANGDATSYLHLFLPVKKGDSVRLTYSGAGAVLNFRFVYAVGEI